MRVDFATRQLARRYEHVREAERAWGREVASRYLQRIELMIAADTFDLLFRVPPLRLHPLRGNRAGSYAMTLVGRWRLVVTPSPDGRTVRVDEVTNHYDD